MANPLRTTPITWRNVQAPSGGAALAAFNQAGQNFGEALVGLGDTVKTGAQEYADSQTAEFLTELNAERDPEKRKQMIAASQAFLDNKQVAAAGPANRAEDRAVTALDQATAQFTTEQEAAAYTKSQRPVVEQRAAEDQANQNLSATIDYETQFTDLVKQRDIDNAYYKDWADPSLVKPAYSREEHIQRFGPSPHTGAVKSQATAAFTPAAPAATPTPPTPAVSAKVARLENAVSDAANEFEQTTRKFESANGMKLVNPDPDVSASGLYGIDDGTARGLMKSNPGLTLEEAKGKKGFDLLTAQHSKSLEAYGLQDNVGAKSVFHVLGDSDATKMFNAIKAGKGDMKSSSLQLGKNAKVDAEIRAKNPAWFGGDPTVQEVVNRISIERSGDVFTLGNPTADATVAQTKTALLRHIGKLEKPSGAKFLNPNIPLSDDPTRLAGQRTRIAAKAQEFGEWALAKAGYKSGKRYKTTEIYNMLVKGTAFLKNDAGASEARAIVLDTMMGRGIDVSSLGSAEIAKATSIKNDLEGFDRVLNRISDPSRMTAALVDNIADGSDATAAQFGAIAAPYQIPGIRQGIIDHMNTITEDGSTPFGTTDPATGVFTPSSSLGLKEFNKEILRKRAEYKHIPATVWNEMYGDLVSLLSIDSTKKQNETAKQDKADLVDAKAENHNEVSDAKLKYLGNHRIETLADTFDIDYDELTEVFDYVFKRHKFDDGVPVRFRKAMIVQAMKEVGRVEEDSTGLLWTTTDYETVSAEGDFADQGGAMDVTSSKALDLQYADISNRVNELVEQYSNTANTKHVGIGGKKYELPKNWFIVSTPAAKK